MTADGKAALEQRLALWGPAFGVLLLHAAFASTYGIFRDELYYLACAARLDWGYVDHPPLVAALTAAWTELFGSSLFSIRLLPALAGAGAVAVAGSIARRMGGGTFAIALTGLSVGLSPIFLGLTCVLSMNAFDLLFWALAFRLATSLLDGGDERLWLAFGAVAGVGLQNKISMLFLGFGLLVGLLAARRFDLLRSGYLWLGGALAAILFAPHLVWQQLHGWPTREFVANASQSKNVALAPLDFLAKQVLQTGPLHAVVWLCGLAVLLFAVRFRRWRAHGVAYFAIYCVAYYGLRFLGIFFHFVRIERLDQTRFKVIGGVLASLVSLVPLTMLGNILATVPINNIQTVLSSSWVLRLLINWNFPVSQIIQHLWTSVI